MAKNFYISVPFYPIEKVAPTKEGLFSALKSIVAPSKFVKALSNEDLENYKVQLNQRVELITQGVSGLGIETKILKKDELTNLFYSYYNPGQKAA